MSNHTDYNDSISLFECAMSTIASTCGFPYAMALYVSDMQMNGFKHITDNS